MQIVYLDNGLKCLRSQNAFIMGIDEFPPRKYREKHITGVRWDSRLQQFLLYTKGWKLYQVYDESHDPYEIMEKPNKYGVPLFPDMELEDGSKLSDELYFSRQKDLLIKALTWRFHQLAGNKKKVNGWIRDAIRSYESYILQARKVDISKPVSATETDLFVLEHLERFNKPKVRASKA
jgi:hypothetical protein